MLNLIRLSIAVAFDNFWRFILSTLAIAAAATIVLWMASTYHAIFQSFDDYANLAFGRYQLAIAPIDFEAETAVPDEAVQALREDRRIEAVDTYWSESVARVDLEFPSQVGQTSGPGEIRPRGQLTYLFMTTESTSPPHPMVRGDWINPPNGGQGSVQGVVLREDVAKSWGSDVGSRFHVRRSDGAIELIVQGVISAPLLKGASSTGIHSLTPNQAECFVSESVARKIFSTSPQVSLAGVQIAEGSDIHALRFDWAHRLSQFEQPVQFQHAYELEEQLDQSATARSIQIQSYVAIAFSALLTAIATLWGSNLGVESKIQQLGMLRAIGFTRAQVAAVPAMEGILRGILAWSLSMAAAVGLQFLPSLSNASIFKHGISLQGGLWAAGAILAGGLIAIVSQLRIALKVHPLDAIAVSGASSLELTSQALTDSADAGPESIESREKPRRKSNWVSLVIALVSMLVAGVVASYTSLGWDETATASVVASALVVAFLASAFATYIPFWKLVLRLIERFAPTQSLMLQQQIMHVGMRKPIVPIALSSCLTLFLAIHLWGATLMEAFVPGGWLPEAMAHRKTGITSAQLDAFQRLPGVAEDQALGVYVEQVRLAEDLLGSKERATVTRQDNVLVIGIDPAKTWDGASPLLDVVWQTGEKSEAIEQLKAHRGCLVVDHFLDESGLRIGDKVRLVPPRRKSSEAVEYTIVGAVELPGWHWQTKHTQMRTRSHRTAAMIFIDEAVAAADYQMDNFTHLWFNQTEEKSRAGSLSDQSVGIFGAAEPLQIVTAESIRERVRQTSRQWLWIISIVPMIGLGIATLSFVQMQIASLRSRAWELGVMRSLGFQKSEVIRVWVIEIGLILLFALVHSFVFGWLVSYCAVHYTQQFSFFGGVDTPMRWPLAIFLWCFVFGAIIVFVGGFAPARLLLRKMPIQLLNASTGWGSRK